MERPEIKRAHQKTQILAWNEIREKVRQVNREFADIVDDLKPQDKPKLCMVEYPYGSTIFDKRKFFIFNEKNRQVPIDDVTIAKQYKDFFGHNSAPLAMVLNKSISLSVEEKKQFVPLYMFYPGQIHGLWDLLDRDHPLFNTHQWSLYSGTRSLFTTTKISNLKKHQSLKRKFNLKSKPPKYLKDHHPLFTELANHPSIPNNWRSTVLFFSKNFQDQLMQKKSLLPLRTYFLERSWRQSMPRRFDPMMRIMWNQVSNLLKRNQFKNFSLQLSTLKHVIVVALGSIPCFTANDPDELTAPIDLIKEILIDEYKTEFCPTIMTPSLLSKKHNRYGYYSVNESKPIEEAYINKTKKTSIETMRSIFETYHFIKNNIANNNSYIDDDMIKILADTKLDFFHSMFDQRELLQMSSALPTQDPSLTQLPKKYGKSVLPFNENGSFFRGLIRINISDFSL